MRPCVSEARSPLERYGQPPLVPATATAGEIDAKRLRRAIFLDAVQVGPRRYFVSGGISPHQVNLDAVNGHSATASIMRFAVSHKARGVSKYRDSRIWILPLQHPRLAAFAPSLDLGGLVDLTEVLVGDALLAEYVAQ